MYWDRGVTVLCNLLSVVRRKIVPVSLLKGKKVQLKRVKKQQEERKKRSYN
jgi:hypothetical protein